jgi:hypothetical protein
MATPGKIERDVRVFVRDKFTCAYCGYVADTFEKWRYLTVDHFIPKSKGGSDTVENLVTACMDCNVIKSDELFTTLDKARAEIGVYRAKERADYDKHFAAQLEAANAERTSPPDPWIGSGDGDEVAGVTPEDLKKVVEMGLHFQERHAVESGGIDKRMFQNAAPNADTMAVWFRASILQVLQRIPESPLAPWTHDGKLDPAVFEVAATIPMMKMKVGVVRDGLPFDLPEFLRLVGEAKG